MIGPGKYDDLCTILRKGTGAGAVMLIVGPGGPLGPGISCCGPPLDVAVMVCALQKILPEMEKELAEYVATIERLAAEKPG